MKTETPITDAAAQTAATVHHPNQYVVPITTARELERKNLNLLNALQEIADIQPWDSAAAGKMQSIAQNALAATPNAPREPSRI